MHLPRFFLNEKIQTNTHILLPKAISHHAKQVLRLRNYSNIILFNGESGEFKATIEFQKDKTFALISSFDPREAELDGDITLIQSMTTNNKMDFIIEKASELGVKTIIPLYTKRSIIHIANEKLEKRMSHWSKIAESASEQCGRNRITKIAKPIEFNSYMASPLNNIHLFCNTKSNIKIEKLLLSRNNINSLSIMIGPEGGWSQEECLIAESTINIYPVNSGSRILRTETAGIVITSIASSTLLWNN
ncbi:ribosomal RNA small subunit methyltransferase E [Candidatus Kinetoplastibacterium desouzaii TCC079E]|uniref:Ribosomal RNA small subunit methyltransferase E n=1 Tax=Candidatus Kinetoplastidibacterium desouzai TCC079E TaxID=1208919 RepID=M1M333_9PROT|nr:16S rRNA (uracil(1498)-N(3))-methyltransferase [Candidatus Kinetoplastibacterium desouzaii]AGF46680.1 ribosomal RNA small subunit methyltransferase E [Candidatus Kinetoplastibacterium desouzaii TCC079E]